MSQQLKESQETKKQDKKIPTVEQERIPMIIYNSELSEFLVTVSDAQQHCEFYQFPVKDLFISPPTPPPKC